MSNGKASDAGPAEASSFGTVKMIDAGVAVWSVIIIVATVAVYGDATMSRV